MTTIKTAKNDQDVIALLESVKNEKKRKDSFVILELMKQITKETFKIWGNSIVGFGTYHYKYESGREGDMLITGFSPRKANLVMYIMPGYRYDSMQEKLSRLGKHKLGKSCLYINKLADVDLAVLEEIVRDGVAYMHENYETWDE